MKYFKLLILFVFIQINLNAQYFNLKRNEIRKMKIQEVTEWTVVNDSLRNDSLKVVLLYDTLGCLVEKKYSFDDSGRRYISVSYVYNNKGFLIDSIYYNPYSISFVPFYNEPDSGIFIVYDDEGVKIVNKIWRNGNTEVLKYSYGYCVVLNRTSFFYLSKEDFWELTFELEYIFDNDCYLCKKDDMNNIYDGSQPLLDNIVFEGGQRDKKIIFTYKFYK